MVFFLFAKMPGIQSQIKQSYGHLTHPFSSLHSPSFSSVQSTTPSSSSSSSSSGTRSKISPTILFTVVIVALIVFISGLIHFLVRFLLKRTSSPLISQSNRHPSSDQISSGSGSLFQRQLRQLFHLHDSGLDQALIDALPLFLYKEIMGLKEPFDCAVCLCEFSQQDKLRLLPLCSHAFHIDCIDTWLLSNSTCPLCRGTISTPEFFYMENPVFDFDCSREEEDEEEGEETTAQKTGEDEIVSEKRVFPVRLGKFKSTNGGRETEEGETTRTSSSSNLDLDGSRCYSLGSFQYVVGNLNLEVALCCPNRTSNSNGGLVKGRASQNGKSTVDGDIEGKKINIRSKGESFSVSKIWLWSKKGRFPAANASLPWIDRAQGR